MALTIKGLLRKLRGGAQPAGKPALEPARLPDMTHMSDSEKLAAYERYVAQQQAYTEELMKSRDEEHIRAEKKIADLTEKLGREQQEHEDEVKKLKDKLAIEKEDNRKLKTFKENYKTVVENLETYVKTLGSLPARILAQQGFTPLDDFTVLLKYMMRLVRDAVSMHSSLIFHQARSLNLGTSEKNRGTGPGSKLGEDDLRSIEDGKADKEDQPDEASGDDPEDTDPGEPETGPESVDVPRAEVPDKVQEKSPAGTGEKGAGTAGDGGSADTDAMIRAGMSHKDQERIEDSALAVKHSIGDLDKAAKQKPNYHNEGVTTRRKTEYISVVDSGAVAGIIDPSSKEFSYYCPACGKAQVFRFIGKIERLNKILISTGPQNEIGSAIAPVFNARCTQCGYTTEINPASLIDVDITRDLQEKDKRFSLSREGGSEVPGTDAPAAPDADAPVTPQPAAGQAPDSHDDAAGQPAGGGDTVMTEQDAARQKRRDYHAQSKDRQQDRREAYRSIRKAENTFSQNTRVDKVFKDNGVEIIEPWAINYEAYSMTPAFSKSVLSTGLLASCAALFSQLCSPKNRTFTFFQGQGLPLSREQLTGAINSFSRAFLCPIAKHIKRDMLSITVSILMDGSTGLVREAAKAKLAQGKSRKSQIAVTSTSWTSKIQASWYTVCDSRGADSIVEVLKDVKESGTVKYLTVDGYSGYDSAVRILKEQYGIEIKLTRCLTHLRRPLHRYLNEAGLLKVYNQDLLPCGSSFADFCDNLGKYTAAGKPLTLKERELLCIYYAINSLFYVDSSVVRRHEYETQTEEFRKDLQEARTKYSAPIMDALFDAIRLFAIRHPEVLQVSVSKDDPSMLRFKGSKMYPESKALLFILQHEQEVRRVLESPDIELSQSACERALKNGIMIRKNCEFFDSRDGAHAFADYLTVSATCARNGVPTLPYILWVVANIKKRLIDMRIQGHDDPTMFQMPHRQPWIEEVTDANGKVRKKKTTIGMYDPRNHTCYDRIDVSGLMPYDYRRYLDERGPRAKAARS